MDIQQILATAKGQAPGAKGSDDTSGAGDFAAALSALSQANGAAPAEHPGNGQAAATSPAQALKTLVALAQGGSDALPEDLQGLTALPEELQGLTALPEGLRVQLSEAAGEGGLPQDVDVSQAANRLLETLQARLAATAGQDTASDPVGKAAASNGASPELAAVMERLALIQGAGRTPGQPARDTAATPALNAALGQATPRLATGQPGQAASAGSQGPSSQAAPNMVLEAAARRQESGQASSPSLAAALEANTKPPTQSQTGQTPLTATGSASPQAMMEALMARREGGVQETPNGMTGGLSGVGPGSTPASSSPQGMSAPQATPQQAALTAPVNSPAWPRQLGQQLIRFGQGGGEQRIEMQLHPTELGPLSVTLKVGEQGAQAQFLSAHAQVRQALEQAIPQLREALAEQGISLGETSVGEQHQGQAEGDGSGFAHGAGGDGGDPDEALIAEAGGDSVQEVRLDGRVDLYA